jgi:alcohol dehydrogenase class IV
VEAGVARAREWGADLIVGFGGGSAIDAAKAIAVLATNTGSLFEYLEVIGAGKPIEQPPLPLVALPTTAGTGAEATRNAVLASPEHKVKVSLRSPLMLPKVAIIDPELTHGLPPEITATTGLDALTQLIEAFVSCRANALTDTLCRDGIARAASALPSAFAHASLPDAAPARTDPRYHAAREGMALASLWSGIALANAGLGAVHGFAGPLGGMFGAPHGAICAALLPQVMLANIDASRQRAPADPALGRYTEIGRMLEQRLDATAEDGVDWVRRLCADFNIAPLARHGVTAGHFPALVAGARRASSMKGNPIALTEEELTAVLQRSL